jgi:hypothetical protein
LSTGPGRFSRNATPGSPVATTLARVINTTGRHHRHRANAALREWRDAITMRTTLLVVGVFALMIAFVLSYIGGLHHPKPYHMDLAVAAPATLRAQVVGRLNAVPGEPVAARAVRDAGTARYQVTHRRADGALVVGPGTAHLLVAGAAGPAMASALEEVAKSFAAQANLSFSVHDVRPVSAQDSDGLSSFYLVVAWSVGGYLVASMLGISAGTRPATLRRAVIRLAAMAVYSVLAGLGGAIAVGPVLGALPASVGQLWWIGALVVFATAAFTMAMQAVAGVIGIGIAIAVFVVLGNPSAGGVFPAPLLPPFWRAVGPWITTGAATQMVRNVTYFGSAQLTTKLLVLLAYLVVGVVVSLVVSGLRARKVGAATG